MAIRSVAAVAVLLSAGCVQHAGRGGARARAALALDSPVEFTVVQRQTAPVPGSGGGLLITLGDITGGRVLTGLSWEDGERLVAVRSLREGDVVRFGIRDRTYTLSLKKLVNVLVGDDSATFKLSPDDSDAGTGSAEDARIAALIEAVRSCGLVWIRNDREMSSEAMGDHMEMKLDGARERGYAIPDTASFIELNSRSLATGRPYEVRLPDGNVVTAGDWLQQKLGELEGAGQ